MHVISNYSLVLIVSKNDKNRNDNNKDIAAAAAADAFSSNFYGCTTRFQSPTGNTTVAQNFVNLPIAISKANPAGIVADGHTCCSSSSSRSSHNNSCYCLFLLSQCDRNNGSHQMFRFKTALLCHDFYNNASTYIYTPKIYKIHNTK